MSTVETQPRNTTRRLIGTVLVLVAAAMALVHPAGYTMVARLLRPLEVVLIRPPASEQAVDLQALQAENIQLRQRLAALEAEPQADNGVRAEVINFTPDPYRRMIRVNAGSNEGVKAGDPVLSRHSLVGIVKSVEAGHAIVQLVIDPQFRTIAVNSAGSRGLLTGKLSGMLLSRLPREAPIEIGDNIVTSGLDGRLPAGLPVGRLAAVFDTEQLLISAQVVPLVDLAHLRVVFIQTGAP